MDVAQIYDLSIGGCAVHCQQPGERMRTQRTCKLILEAQLRDYIVYVKSRRPIEFVMRPDMSLPIYRQVVYFGIT